MRKLYYVDVISTTLESIENILGVKKRCLGKFTTLLTEFSSGPVCQSFFFNQVYFEYSSARSTPKQPSQASVAMSAPEENTLRYAGCGSRRSLPC